MKRAAMFSLFGLSACTCIFNPDNIPKNTCEPLPTTPLEAIAGDGTSLTFEWPSPAGHVDLKDWKLCWGALDYDAGACATIPYRNCNDGGSCTFTVNGPDAGLKYNRRVSASLVLTNACNNQSAPQTVSTTPINGSFLDTQGITLTPGCDAGIHVVTPGELVFDHTITNGFCVSTATMGDDLWRDGTIDLDVRVFGETVGGLVLRSADAGAGPRNGIVMTASAGYQASVYVTQRDSAVDVGVASAVPVVRDAEWTAMRVSMFDRSIPLALGPTQSQLREVIRWRGPNERVDGGQLGFAIASGGVVFPTPARLEAKNLRVRTHAVIPDGGPTRDGWTFAGPDNLHAVRRLGSSVVACPPFDAGCSTCAPDAGSACLEVMGANSQASIEVPIGIDYSKPWRVKFKFAAEAPGVANGPSILRTTVARPMANILESFAGFPVIDAPGFNWNQELRAYQNNAETLGLLTPGIWSSFELLINPFDSTYQLTRNGVLARSGGSPPTLSPHLGSLVLGGSGGYRGWFTDLEISQDP